MPLWQPDLLHQEKFIIFQLLVSNIMDMCESTASWRNGEMLLNCYPLHAVFDRIDSFAFQVGYAWSALPFFAAG